MTRQQTAEAVLTCPRCDYGTCDQCRARAIALCACGCGKPAGSKKPHAQYANGHSERTTPDISDAEIERRYLEALQQIRERRRQERSA